MRKASNMKAINQDQQTEKGSQRIWRVKENIEEKYVIFQKMREGIIWEATTEIKINITE